MKDAFRWERTILILFLLIGLAGNAILIRAAGTPEKSLYSRLGGYDAIAAVTDDFIGRLATDPQLSRFFSGLSVDSKKRVREHVVDQLCEATGGPCVYTGRTMKTAHAGLGITNNDWNVTVNHLVETLNKFNVPEREQNDLLTALTKLKADIVEK
ncbi:MAG: group 1 truncated hemoglobin [Acidobacteriia bacterium]|nr:group 1 truncated hemoglobin [Terriglobia bacterium]